MNNSRKVAFFAMAFLAAIAANARATTVGFDGIGTSTQVSGASVDSLLASYGISVSGGSAANQLDVISSDYLTYIDPSPYTNFLMQQQSDGGQSFTLDFATPVDSVSFTRPELIAGSQNGIVMAAWSETAYNGAGAAVGSNGDSLMLASYANVPAQTYTITAADVTAVTFWADGYGFAGVPGVPIGDLQFTSTVPEPSTLVLFGLGLAALTAWSVRRRRSQRV